jgi:hypothetical protein
MGNTSSPGTLFTNPFRPGAGHTPPYLAGREKEKSEFSRLLEQDVILDNLVLTGLRGVGKTVLLDTFKPIAVKQRWLWASSDLSESTSVSEAAMALRIITDLSVVTSSIVAGTVEKQRVGFGSEAESAEVRLTFDRLNQIYTTAPGLIADKLKTVLEVAWGFIEPQARGVVFAYDEAQNLDDREDSQQYPLSILLDVFQSLQKKGVRFLLVLTGLPTLFPKLVEARTFAERMFRVLFLSRLSAKDSRDAITKPIEVTQCPAKFDEKSVELIVVTSGGYPYFIQYICRAAYDTFVLGSRSVPVNEIIRKLDSDFFAGRWSRATDRQRELLFSIARLPNADEEFSVSEIVEASQELDKPFSASHVNQMLVTLAGAGLIYKNRHGKYSFAVPLFGQYVIRQMTDSAPPTD